MYTWTPSVFANVPRDLPTRIALRRQLVTWSAFRFLKESHHRGYQLPNIFLRLRLPSDPLCREKLLALARRCQSILGSRSSNRAPNIQALHMAKKQANVS